MVGNALSGDQGVLPAADPAALGHAVDAARLRRVRSWCCWRCCWRLRHVAGLAGCCWLPVWIALVLLLALGVGLIAAALTVEYRDVQYILPILIPFMLYASPVAYDVAQVPRQYQRAFYVLNPLAALIDGFRWSLLGTPPPPCAVLAVVGGVCAAAVRVRGRASSAAPSGNSPMSSSESRHFRPRRRASATRSATTTRADDARRSDRRGGFAIPFARQRARAVLGAEGRQLRRRARRGASASSAATAPARARC